MFRFIIILLLLLLSYSKDASAACTNPSGGATTYFCENEGESYAQNAAGVAWLRANGHGACTISSTYVEVGTGAHDRLMFSLASCSTNVGAWYPKGQLCSTLPPITGSGDYNAGNDGDIRCYQGCQQVVNEDSSSFSLENNGAKCYSGISWGAGSCPANYVWNNTFAICSPLPPDADGDGVPDSLDQWPTDPTRTVDTDGDGFADEFDAFPADPTQNADTDGDGVGDSFDFMPNDPDNGQDSGTGNETDNTSSGGGSCNSPPSSTGDAITAQIAYQTWATRCAAERTNDKLDEVKAAISAQGSPTVNVTVEGGSGSINGDVSGMSLDEGVTGVVGGSGNVEDIAIDNAEFDSSGFLGGDRSCPEFPVLDVMGATLDFNVPHLCTFFEIGAGLVLLFAAVAGLRIIGGS